MDDPIAFGRARMHEDRQTAEGLLFACRIPDKMPDFFAAGGPAAEAFWHRYNPARVLREIDAVQAVLGMHRAAQPHSEFGFTYPAAARFCGYCGPGDNWQAEHEPDFFPDAVWPCLTVRRLLAIWGDHPGYRQEWAQPPPVRV